MNCVWEPVGEPGNDGAVALRCKRRGCRRNDNPLPPKKRARVERMCDAWPEPHELGHWLALILAALCIRKDGYLWLKAKLGLAPKCGCSKREAKLNTLGKWLSVARWGSGQPPPDPLGPREAGRGSTDLERRDFAASEPHV